MNRKAAVRTYIVPGWHDLLAELSTHRKLTQALAGKKRIWSGTPARTSLAHSAEIEHMRSILRLEVGQPTPRIIWNLAALIRSCHAEYAWCAGPLLLFAAGYFDLYMTLMLRAGPQVTHARKIALVNATIGACRKQMNPDERSELEEIRNADWPNKIKAKAVKQLLSERGEVQAHPERTLWKLKPKEWGAFESIFRRIQSQKKKASLLAIGRSQSNAEFVTTLATMHPEAGLDRVQNLTIWATSKALAGG